MSEAVSARLMRILLGAAGALGGDLTAIAAAAGIPLDVLGDDDARLPHGALLAFWREGSRATGDDAFGLHIAEVMQRHSPTNVLAYAIHSSPTLGEALHRCARYAHLIHGAMEVAVYADERARVRVHNLDPLGSTRHGHECALATAYFLGRIGTASSFVLSEVTFRHPRPASTAEHARIFGAPLRFDAAADEIIFDRTLLELPMLRADRDLGRRLEGVLDELVSRVGDSGFIARVRRAIGANLHGGLATIDDVAERLSLSTRSLQRRLRDAGTSFQELANDLRRDLALRYLSDPGVSISEVTFLLGFAEVSAFHRAFRRWTGLTPAEHRSQRSV